ncbi:hypothetical protein [Methylobacterium aerolatum]|uniref:Uncharacterized protein n=1 Tax=Methylobacterium aerolatum TaxID=418708 RepID=A0ABU0HVG6_9HYPH|nr:hypothetical protein [Methylobacterium aerolatum]MDQ0446332.1 hypothetical protein [Methylobacterium aerolatum]GJD35674.1 hypothetical protein FMGBMHLM_2586 [Methylobacterium aerolatum]
MAQHPEPDEDKPVDLARVNDLLADWAARSATTSGPLLDRFEAMGYAVRGKSEDEIAEVLRHPPKRPR